MGNRRGSEDVSSGWWPTHLPVRMAPCPCMNSSTRRGPSLQTHPVLHLALAAAVCRHGQGQATVGQPQDAPQHSGSQLPGRNARNAPLYWLPIGSNMLTAAMLRSPPRSQGARRHLAQLRSLGAPAPGASWPPAAAPPLAAPAAAAAAASCASCASSLPHLAQRFWYVRTVVCRATHSSNQRCCACIRLPVRRPGIHKPTRHTKCLKRARSLLRICSQRHTPIPTGRLSATTRCRHRSVSDPSSSNTFKRLPAPQKCSLARRPGRLPAASSAGATEFQAQMDGQAACRWAGKVCSFAPQP